MHNHGRASTSKSGKEYQHKANFVHRLIHVYARFITDSTLFGARRLFMRRVSEETQIAQWRLEALRQNRPILSVKRCELRMLVVLCNVSTDSIY